MISAFERDLATAQWPRSAAELAGRGITRAHARSRNWRRTSRGYFVPASAPEGSAGQRILNAAPLVPEGGALAGWAAAYIHGVDLLDGVDPATMRPLPVAINLGSDLGQIRYGLAVTSPVRTALDGGRWAADPVESVVFLDQITRALGLGVDELNAGSFPPSRDCPGQTGSATRGTGQRQSLGVATAHVLLPPCWAAAPRAGPSPRPLDPSRARLEATAAGIVRRVWQRAVAKCPQSAPLSAKPADGEGWATPWWRRRSRRTRSAA